MPRVTGVCSSLAICVLLSPFLHACGHPGGARAGVAVRDSAGVRIVESDPAAAAAGCELAGEPSVDIGVVEGAPEYQLFRVTDAARLHDGRVAVVNSGSHEVRIYGPDGRFLHAFGGEGDGPGEFRLPARIWEHADSLVVYDARGQRLAWFTRRGAFIRHAPLRPVYANPPRPFLLPDGRIVTVHHHFTVPPSGFREQPLYVIVHAADGQVTDTLGRYAFGRLGPVGPPGATMVAGPLFEPRTRVAAWHNRVYVGRGLEREIEVLRLDGTMTGLIRWMGPDRSVTDEDVRRARDGFLEEADTPAERAVRRRLFEQRPVSDRLPALDELLVGRAGRLWVREYSRPGSYGAARWLVFDPEGAFLCRLRTPRELRLLEAGSDYALGSWRDGLGVERVRAYVLTAGTRDDGRTDAEDATERQGRP